MQISVWQGFDHYWQREPHRLNRFGSFVEYADGENENTAQGQLHSMMKIGRFPPDVCHAHSMVHRAGNTSTRCIDGTASLTVSGKLGERIEQAGERITHRLPAAGLTATVILRGFELDCSFSHGFHTRGFGYRLTEIEQQQTNGSPRIAFTPRFFLFPDRSPDPFTHPEHLMWRLLPFPKGLEPRTPDDFEYTMTLQYSVIYDETSRVNFTTHTLHEGPVKSRHTGPGAGRIVEAQEVTGEAEKFPQATVGIQGFRWELNHWQGTRYDGRYLRKVQCMIDGLDYDPASGTMTLSPKMEFNNFGGRQGREQVSRWLDYLRVRREGNENRIRTAVRALRGSYGFVAEYEMDVALLQFEAAHQTPVAHLYNVLRKNETESQSFHL